MKILLTVTLGILGSVLIHLWVNKKTLIFLPAHPQSPECNPFHQFCQVGPTPPHQFRFKILTSPPKPGIPLFFELDPGHFPFQRVKVELLDLDGHETTQFLDSKTEFPASATTPGKLLKGRVFIGLCTENVMKMRMTFHLEGKDPNHKNEVYWSYYDFEVRK